MTKLQWKKDWAEGRFDWGDNWRMSVKSCLFLWSQLREVPLSLKQTSKQKGKEENVNLTEIYSQSHICS